MCDPISIGLAIASTASSVMGQKQATDAQEQAQVNASKAERQRHLHEVSAMRQQQGQELVAAALKLAASSKKAMEARAMVKTSAGESGVAGLSVDALINDLTRKEAEHNFTVNQQTQMSDVNRQLQLRDAGLGFTNNMLRINKPIEQPDYLGAVISGASTGLSANSSLK